MNNRNPSTGSASSSSYVDAVQDFGRSTERVEIHSVTTVTRYQSDYPFVASEFLNNAEKWRSETKFFSNPSDKYLHPSYARIIGLGPQIVGLLLESLTTRPADWFYALRAITGVNPVADRDAGRYENMKAAWLAWGRAQGIVRVGNEAAKAS